MNKNLGILITTALEMHLHFSNNKLKKFNSCFRFFTQDVPTILLWHNVISFDEMTSAVKASHNASLLNTSHWPTPPKRSLRRVKLENLGQIHWWPKHKIHVRTTLRFLPIQMQNRRSSFEEQPLFWWKRKAASIKGRRMKHVPLLADAYITFNIARGKFSLSLKCMFQKSQQRDA